MSLLKLHGSVNWRVPLGHRSPYAADSIRHHEEWFKTLGEKVGLDAIEPYLETGPIIVPPVLTKTELVEQPILRLTWSLALASLRQAKKVVFLGYSMPLTDIAASFLFREGLRHLEHSKDVEVVDFIANDGERGPKLDRLLPAYRSVFPDIAPERFVFSGAIPWIRDNLTQWLYDSTGEPVAFIAIDHVFSRSGRFIGTIRVYEPTHHVEIWHGPYKGEIVEGNRLLWACSPPTEDKGGSAPFFLAQVPRSPEAIGPIKLPVGYADLDWTDEGRLYAKPAGLHDPPAS
jgi:hypothetical protein